MEYLLLLLLPWRIKGKWTLLFVTLFKNSDDPLPIVANKPLWPDKPLWQRKVLWWVRNPFPDFVSYVIGIRGWEFTTKEWGIGNFYINFKITKLLPPLPCIGYISGPKGKTIQFYLGWKSNGAFGLKLTFPP